MDIQVSANAEHLFCRLVIVRGQPYLIQQTTVADCIVQPHPLHLTTIELH